MQKIILIAALAVLIVSCRSTRKIGTAIAKKDTVEVIQVTHDAKADSIAFIKSFIDRVKSNRIDFHTFNAKLNIDYKDATDKNYNVNAVLRMYKDSAIWISANAILGIEAIRVIITKDSVKILDKLNKTFTARSRDYLQDVTALPLDLTTLQDLIIGNPVYLDSNVVSYARANNSVSLLSIGEWFKNLLTLNESDQVLQKSKLDDLDISHNRTADLIYSDYENKRGKPFSTKRRISISSAKRLDIKLEFKQYDFNNEVSFPFSIPKNFKRN
jgi:hypothetical protein